MRSLVLLLAVCGCAVSHARLTDSGLHPTIVVSSVVVDTDLSPTLPPPPDRVAASWTTSVVGASGSRAVLTSARMTFALGEATQLERSIDVAPATIGLVGGSGAMDQRKTGGTADLSHTPVVYDICSAPRVRIDLVFQFDDGSSVPVAVETVNHCAS